MNSTQTTPQSGDKFTRWLVIGDVITAPHRRRMVMCRCECGTERLVEVWHLRNGITRSCGCMGSEILAARTTTHGRSNTHPAEYRAWLSMVDRCTSDRHRSYQNYGGRGIGVCQRWLESIDNFIADMGPRPDGCSLDRIDNDKGYEPSNCRWATAQEQSNNRRTNVRIEHDGRTMTVKEWAVHFGIKYDHLQQRLKRGLPMAEAIKPPRHWVRKAQVSS